MQFEHLNDTTMDDNGSLLKVTSPQLKPCVSEWLRAHVLEDRAGVPRRRLTVSTKNMVTVSTRVKHRRRRWTLTSSGPGERALERGLSPSPKTHGLDLV